MWRRFDEMGRAVLTRSLVVVTIGWAASAAMAQETPRPSGLPQQPDIQQLPGMKQQQGGAMQQQAMRAMSIGGVTSETAKVVKVDKTKKKLTLQDDQGQKVTVDASSAPNFDAIHEGDKVNVKYYEAAAIAIHKPGEAATTSEIQTGTARVKSSRPMGLAGETVTTTLTVVSVDASKKQLTLKAPDGNTQTVSVDDPQLQQNLSKLKAGDQISLSYTEAVAVAVIPQK